MTEVEIKTALILLHKKQRWLLGMVRKLGFPKLTEQNLSKIIRRKYEGSKNYADSVLEAVESILKSKKEVA